MTLFNFYFFLTFIFVLKLNLGFSQTQNSAITTSSDAILPDTIDQTNKLFFDADSLLKHAKKFIGKRYRYHGSSPKTGFDCSGFVMYNFNRYKIRLPHSSYEQIKFGEKIEIADTKAGDLIFFKGRSTKSRLAGHVGIVVSVNGGIVKFIHSSTSLGVRYDYTNAHYYKVRFLGIRRLTKETIVLAKKK